MVNIIEYISKVPQFLTGKTTELLNSNGFIVSGRWTSGIFLLFSLLLFYLGIKIAKPIIRWILIILSILLLIGLFIPTSTW